MVGVAVGVVVGVVVGVTVGVVVGVAVGVVAGVVVGAKVVAAGLVVVAGVPSPQADSPREARIVATSVNDMTTLFGLVAMFSPTSLSPTIL